MSLPRRPAAQREHLDHTGHCLLCDYLDAERKETERIVFENDHVRRARSVVGGLAL